MHSKAEEVTRARARSREAGSDPGSLTIWAVTRGRHRDLRGVVKGLERTLVGPGVLGRVEAVVGCALGLDLGEKRVAVQRRVPRERAAREE